MLSTENHLLPNQRGALMFPDGSDANCDLRDAGSSAEAASAGPAGCRHDEVERKPDEPTGDVVASAESAGRRPEAANEIEAVSPGERSSETAQDGSSDHSSTEISTPAESIRSRRDFETFLRNSGFSRSGAKSLAAGGWIEAEQTESADDAPVEDLGDAIGELIRLMREP